MERFKELIDMAHVVQQRQFWQRHNMMKFMV